jgi:hypothetical protein
MKVINIYELHPIPTEFDFVSQFFLVETGTTVFQLPGTAQLNLRIEWDVLLNCTRVQHRTI